MKGILFLGCGYLGFNWSEGLKSSFPVKVWGLPSPYSKKSTCFTEIDCFDVRQWEMMDIEDYVVIDTITLLGNNATSNNEENTLDTINQKYIELFKQFKKSNIKQYFFVSSGGTLYGDSESAFNEESVTKPKTLYAKSKELLEKTLMSSGLNYCIMRLSNPYGGYQVTDKKQGVIPILIEKALNNEHFQMWGRCDTVRDYIYITDTIEIIKRLIQLNTQNIVVNVGSGLGVSLEEVIHLVERHCHCDVIIDMVESDVEIIQKVVLDVSKLTSIIKFSCLITIDEGIKKEVNRIMEERKCIY